MRSVDGPEVGHDVLGLPADIGGRVEGGLHLRAGHLLQDFQRDALGPVAGHDAVDGAVADTVPAAAIIEMPRRRISMMPRMVVLFCIENDTPFSQQRLQKRLYHTQTRNAPFIRKGYTAQTETLTPPEAKGSHRSGEICRISPGPVVVSY